MKKFKNLGLLIVLSILIQTYVQAQERIPVMPIKGKKASNEVRTGRNIEAVPETWVDDDFTSSTPGWGTTHFDAIQDAIDNTQSGGTVNVAAGNYYENIIISLPLTILGPNASINPNTGSRVAEANLYTAASGPYEYTPLLFEVIIEVNSSNVTIKGLYFNGNNPSLTSGFLINGEDVDAATAIYNESGVGSITVENNIFKTFSYAAVHFYNYGNGGAVTSNNYIRYNYFDNIMPTSWGMGILIYNNFYAEITHNVFDRTRIGIQTGNFYNANTGSTQSISNNEIETNRLGIFFNLMYSGCSTFNLSNNTITPVTGVTTSRGILISSIGSSVSVNVTNNIISNLFLGINLWNDNTTNTITITGGSISGCDYGIRIDNYDGYGPSDGSSTIGKISGVTIQNSVVAGLYIKDNPLNTNNATVAGDILAGTVFSNNAADVLIDGPDASNTSVLTGLKWRFINTGSATPIQYGINMINAGNILLVDAGTYAENVTVNKLLTILGAGNTTIVQGGTGVAFTYLAAGSGIGTGNMAELKNLKISGSSKGVYASELVNYLKIENVNFDGNSTYAIHVNNTSGTMNDWAITNCTFNANSSAYYGSTASNINGVSITGCQFTNQLNSAIYAGQSNSTPGGWSNVIISDNVFTDNGPSNNQAAMYIEKLTNGVISDNTLTNNGLNTNPRGIIINLKYGSYNNITISDNIFTESRGALQTGGYAINVQGRNDAPSYNTFPGSLIGLTVSGNEISGFLRGIEVDNAVDWTTTSIINNTISGCNYGILGLVFPAGNTANTGTIMAVNKNSITGANPYAIVNGNLNGGVINASGNWFGSNDPAVFTPKLSGSIDYTPWLHSGSDMNHGIPGFQPDLSTLWVDDDSPQTGTSGRIQEAVGMVSGSTIYISAGTYVEPSQVVINKNVTMIGASKATTFIKPGFNTGSSGDARGFILVQSGFAFNLSKVTIDGTGKSVYQGIRQKGSGLIDDCIIKEIKYEPSGPSYAGVAIAAFGGLNINISNCTFSEIGRVGVLYFGAGTTGNYSYNSYTGKGTGNWLDYAVEFGGGAVGTIDNCTFTQCKGVASSDGSTSAGILVTTYYGAGTNASITYSTLTDNTEGIAVGYDATDASTVVANFNKIYNNTSNGVSSTKPLVDAKYNWWGDVTGPLDNKTLPGIPNYNNPGGLGNAVTSYVDYNPWNLAPNYYNTPSTAYKLYISSSTAVKDTIIYPNTAWGVTAYEPDDWDFTAPVDFYIVPEANSKFGACDITLEWDNSLYSFAGVSESGGLFDSPHFFNFNTLGGTNRVTINASTSNYSNFNTSDGNYIAKVSLNLLKPGYGPIKFKTMDFRYFDGLNPPLGVYVTGKMATVKSYLGDVAALSPASEATGDGLVEVADLNTWTYSYWSGVPGYGGGMTYYKVKCDVGPTNTGTIFGQPAIDSKIQFEDLVIFAMSYGASANGIYPKIAPPPTEPVEISVGKPLAVGSETLVPLFISGAVQDLRAASLSFSGNFGKLISAEKGDLLNSYTTPVMLMSRTDGNNVFVDLSIAGADVKGLGEQGQLIVLRFEGKANVNITSAELRNTANVPMLSKLINNSKGIPTEFGLSQNYPNPFNPSTMISYQVPVAAMVQIAVFNSIGEKVGTLVNEVKEPGYYEVTWNASQMPSGVYFFRINAGEFTAVKKMMLTK